MSSIGCKVEAVAELYEPMPHLHVVDNSGADRLITFQPQIISVVTGLSAQHACYTRHDLPHCVPMLHLHCELL